MNFTERQREKIEAMIMKGDKMQTISAEIGGGCTWQDIQQFCWETGAMSWQGSKKMISTRLEKLKTAGKRADRERLAAEIHRSVSYLYFCAKQMRERIVAVEAALQTIK